jgi:hypothetical protein
VSAGQGAAPAGPERVAIYTALFGGYDALPAAMPQDIGVDWICFTDDPGLRADGWHMEVAPARYDHPRMSAKWFKARPDAALPQHRRTIWIDANMQVDARAFAREALAFATDGLAVFRHPQRGCVYREAKASARTAPTKYADQPLMAQVASYRAEGYPVRNGLYALGTIVRDRDMASVRELGQVWLAECERWSYQDQLSFPVVAWRLGITPSVFPYHQHRHDLRDGLACALHRFGPLDGLAVALRSMRPRPGGQISSSPAAGRSRGRWPRSNPWWTLLPHRSDC